MGITIIPMSSMRAVYRSATDSVNAAKEICKQYVTVHSHVNHSADWHGGYTFCPECISPIAVGDSKWRDTLLFAGYL